MIIFGVLNCHMIKTFNISYFVRSFQLYMLLLRIHYLAGHYFYPNVTGLRLENCR
jgi:hypothetical protein